MFLKIALNGARSKSECEYIPHSLEEIERDVRQLYSSGYTVFHIHCYDDKGKESLEPEAVNNLVNKVKNISPKIKLGISSGEWIEPDLNKRIKLIKSWEKIPDFISVNMIEEGAEKICKVLQDKSVLIEAGINEPKAAEVFVNIEHSYNFCRILIEPEDEEISQALKTVESIEKILNENNVKIKRLLHGFNSVSWELITEAKLRGYDSRMGMEDTLLLPDGRKAKSNYEIISEAEIILEGF